MESYNNYFPISVSVGRNISSYFVYLNYVSYVSTNVSIGDLCIHQRIHW